MAPNTQSISYPGDPAVQPDKDKLELLYDGRMYDVTSFINRHPGGKILSMYLKTKEDSMNAVQQLHFRSMNRVKNIMKTLPSRPAVPGDGRPMDKDEEKRYQELDKDFKELFQECIDEGLFEPSYWHVFFRTAFWLSTVLTNVLLSINGYLNPVVAGILIGVFGGMGGWYQHEAGHKSFTGIPKLDRTLQTISIGFMGISAGWWTSMHSRHHAMPNNIKHDVDMKTLPLIAFNNKVLRKRSSSNVLVRYQHLLFWTLDIMLVNINFQAQSLWFCWRKKAWADFLCMLGAYFVYYQLGLTTALVLQFVGGLYLLANFALSHTHLPVTTEPVHWVEYALIHTANIRSGPFNWVDFWMGYLNFQIEHHLFPSLPQFRCRYVTPKLKKLAKKHNLPYIEYDYFEAIGIHFRNLKKVANYASEM